jgi:hypothetical protein
VGALRVNHVFVHAEDIEESARCYGMRRFEVVAELDRLEDDVPRQGEAREATLHTRLGA